MNDGATTEKSTGEKSTGEKTTGEKSSGISASAADRSLAANRACYDALVDVAAGHLLAADPENVLLAATIAANFAWNAAIGILNDPRLESMITDSVRAPGTAAPQVDRSRSNGRVLHVLTHCGDIGGHSRLAWRWIQRDTRRADVALTHQTSAVPAEMLSAVARSGGGVHDLTAAYGSLLEQAYELRRLMERADIVVMHTHPFDAVAIAAANLPGVRPPIIFENHADHTYWLGLSMADVVTDNRPIGGRLCAEVRGIPAQRLSLLPLSVDAQPASAGSSRGELRARLGIPADSVIAVCVAGAGKLRPVFGTGFAEIAAELLERVPALTLLLVGPPAQGEWRDLMDRFPNRFFALGLLSDAASLYPVCDIYLDAYPISSGTALLEAAVAGLPTLSLQEPEKYSDVWTAESPGLTDPLHRAGSRGEYLERIAALAASAKLRRQHGEAARRTVLAAHTGSGWSQRLEAVYAQARRVPSADLAAVSQVEPTPAQAQYNRELLRFMRGSDEPTPFERINLPLAQVVGTRLHAELFAATIGARRSRSPLTLRVGPQWPQHRAWMLRALRLCSTNPGIALSLPVLEGAEDEALLAIVLELLGELGLDGDSCGNVSIEADELVDALALRLQFTANGLDFFAALSNQLLRRQPVGDPAPTLLADSVAVA
ncbi:hypothetical protein SAMN05892883_1301 [Jatrophihabitans sp. GAS493]|uniref:glycosyltransferase n=1 Tax=Jatrophihabitans sp. GAS493 TaxID=1907575 RepID=UPI000BB9513A|nr:glycosyltransferase [Jatrophihabitans sp. GAS493]SOD71835.1 hypothetical protein SAMN05892883_1301 [Jatrophihabitans sp. GAS493]